MSAERNDPWYFTDELSVVFKLFLRTVDHLRGLRAARRVQEHFPGATRRWEALLGRGRCKRTGSARRKLHGLLLRLRMLVLVRQHHLNHFSHPCRDAGRSFQNLRTQKRLNDKQKPITNTDTFFELLFPTTQTTSASTPCFLLSLNFFRFLLKAARAPKTCPVTSWCSE